MSAPGFILLLISAIACCAAPQLENDSCSRPERLDDSELLGDWDDDLYPRGTVAKYNCRPGYIRLGTIKMICKNSKWELIGQKGQCRKKSCGHPGDIPFGSFHLREEDSFIFGAIVKYVCDEGYHMMSKETTRECKHNGWSNHLPQCEEPCQKPEPIKGAQLQGDWTEGTYPPGKVANYLSENAEEGPIKMACVEGSWWHVSKGHCKDIRSECTIPDSPGVLQSPYQSSYQIGSEVMFSCKTGFVRVGSLNSHCTKDGWNPPLPTCTDKTSGCTIPYTPDLIPVPHQTSYPIGKEVIFLCSFGFIRVGSFLSMCTEDGWNQPLPTCEKIQCTFPDHTNLVRKPLRLSYREHDIVSLGCEEGFTLKGHSTVMCSENGWNRPLPICEGIGDQCGPPPVIKFGDTISFSKTSYKSGESVEYQCPEYYILKGNRIVKCLNGIWEEAPDCLEPCTARETDMEERNIKLKWIADKKIYINHGNAIEFSCKDGYEVQADTQLRTVCEQGKLEYPKCFKKK